MDVEPMEIDYDESLVNHDLFAPELICNKEFKRPLQTPKTPRNARGLLDCSIADELPPCELLPFTDEMDKRQPQDNQQNAFENHNTHAKPRKSVLQVCDPLFERTVIEEDDHEPLVNGTSPKKEKLSPLCEDKPDRPNLDNTIVYADNNNLVCANGVCQLIALDNTIKSSPEVHTEQLEVDPILEENTLKTEDTETPADSESIVDTELIQTQVSEEPSTVLLNSSITITNSTEEEQQQLIIETSKEADLPTESGEEAISNTLNSTTVIADASKTIEIYITDKEILQEQPTEEHSIEELNSTVTLGSSSDTKELELLTSHSINGDLAQIEQTEVSEDAEPLAALNETVELNISSGKSKILLVPEESPQKPQKESPIKSHENVKTNNTTNVLEKNITVEHHSPETIECNTNCAKPNLAARSPKSLSKISARDNSTYKLLDFVSPTSKDIHFSSDMDAENEEKMLSIQEMNRMKLELNQTKQELTALTLEHQKKEEVIIKLEAEEHVKEQQRRMEVKQLQEKINELMEKNNCEELLQAQNEIQELRAESNQLKEECAYYKKISSEYESSLSTRNCENENLKMEHAVATQHLANIEAAFSDCIVKYERTKEIIAAYTRNEEKLKEALQASNRIAIKYEQRYEMLKSHASSQLDRANNDIIAEREKNQIEINKLNSLLKRMEIKTLALEQSLDQKTKECEALASLYDEMAGSVPKQ